jgi:T5SS/PEP-CTERM-associated repeat protein
VPSGYIYRWTGKVSGAYGTVGNWFNTTANAAATAVPGTSDEALIVASGSISGPGAAFDLGLSGSGSGLSVSGTLYGLYAYVGGTVTLGSGAALASPNLIDIGDNSSATIASKVPTVLNVGAGSFISATLATPNTFDIVLGQGGGSGTLAVTGGIVSAGTAGFLVGSGGTGVITVGNGGAIQAGTPFGSHTSQIDLALGSSGGSGTLIVNGANSVANFTNTVEVGFGGNGVVSVTGGGLLAAGEGLDSLNIGDASSGSAGNGVVGVDASQAFLAGIVEVGAYGQGSLNLSNGAFVNQYFTVSGQSFSVLIGAQAGSKGTLSLSTQSAMQTTEGIAVGSYGTGELDVSSATLSMYAPAATGTVALDVGAAAGAMGTVNVSGGLINDAYSAGTVIGAAGSGSLSITQIGSQGGTVLTGNATTGIGLSVGVSAGATGNVSVSGAASGLGVYGELDDGGAGTGNIALSAGGRLVTGLGASAVGLVLGGDGGSGALSAAGGAQVAVTGQTQVAASGSGSLSVTGGAGFTGQANGLSALVLGASAGSTGSALVSDASSYANLSGGISVGSEGSGTLTVQNQASVVVGGTAAPTVPAVLIGANAGSTGKVALASGAQVTVLAAGVSVGSDGAGLLSVDNATLTVTTSPGVGVNALNVGVAAGSSGTVTVTGGVIFDTQSAGAIVGDAGTGTLAISQSGTQGGLVLTGNPTGTTGLAVGVGAGSSGNISISGSASGLQVYGTAAIGGSGQGNISLVNGGHFVAELGTGQTGLVLGGQGGAGTMSVGSGGQAYVVGQSIIGNLGAGALSVTGGSSFTGTASGVPAMVIGASSTGTGSVLLSDGSTYVPLTGGLVVGSSGTGSLGVQNNAVLTVYGSTAPNLPGLILGQNSTSHGTVSVSGGGEIIAGTGIALGSFGSGTITVSGGTLMINTAPDLGVSAIDAGVSVGSSGVLDVAGGLVTDTEASGVIIGDNGSGSLSISQVGSQGGTLLTGNLSSSTGFLVGNAASASGSVTVSGAASGLGVYGATVIGASGVGSVTLTGGARFVGGVAADGIGLVMGGNVGGIGSMAMSGAAEASVLGQTDVGQLGSGFLSIAGGSGFTDQATGAPALVVGGGAGSTGNVLVTDSGSYLSLTGGLEVGGAGIGTLTVANGALVASTGALSVGAEGVVVASGTGSALSAGAVTNLGTITASAGTMSFLGAVSGSGLLAIGNNGLFTFASTETNAVGFASGGGSLVAATAADIGGVVSGWSVGDFIDLQNVVAISESFANGTLSLLGSGDQLVGTLAISGALATNNFTLSALAGGGTSIGYHS